ncbi:MAG: hypothetical protein LBF93_07990 [Zoogloeaceae bacterium]|jgi:hypothetical protein|nr:hypothetical protein [Zoogloeaceae bacterium]
MAVIQTIGTGIHVIITRQGIVVIDSGLASQALINRIEQSIITGEASELAVRATEVGALKGFEIYDLYSNTSDILNAQNLNDLLRDSWIARITGHRLSR